MTRGGRARTAAWTPPPPAATAAWRTFGAVGLRRERSDALGALLGGQRLDFRPPRGEFAGHEAGLGAQHQEVVRSAKARMVQQRQRAAPLAPLEARLQQKDLAQRHREAFRYRDAPHLLEHDPIDRLEH